MTTFITFIFLLGLLVLVHEFGHFVTARRFGCKVEEFGFGFPPRLFGWRRKKDGPDGTLYSLNWIPLGGFVKVKGENGDYPDDFDSFAKKKLGQKAIILVAGVVMNVILGMVLLSFGFMIGMPQVLNTPDRLAHVRDHKIQIVEVLSDSPAARASLKAGDVIEGYLSEGKIMPFENIALLQSYLDQHTAQSITLAIKNREMETRQAELTPEFLKEVNRGGIGIGLVETAVVSYPVWLAPVKGAQAALSFLKEIFVAFGGLIRELVVRHKVSADVAGPIGIAVLTGEVVRQGFASFLSFAAILSLNLAVINVIPFPALDGGRLLFVLIEMFSRKKVNKRLEEIIHTIGFTLLLLLVLVVTVKDISHFSDTMTRWWQR